MDISVNGPKIYFEIPVFGGIRITQTTVSLLAVTVLLITAAYFLTRNLSKRPGRAQVLVEKLITMLYGLVEDTMGKHNLVFAPYIGTLFWSSIVGTLLGMTVAEEEKTMIFTSYFFMASQRLRVETRLLK